MKIFIVALFIGLGYFFYRNHQINKQIKAFEDEEVDKN